MTIDKNFLRVKTNVTVNAENSLVIQNTEDAHRNCDKTPQVK